MRARYRSFLAALPRGGALDEVQWRQRHRLLTGLLGLHIPVLFAVALLGGLPLSHAAVDVLPLAVALGVALRGRSRAVISIAVTVGLVVASSVLVHITGGLIESHFHFFAMLGFIGLYHDWRPFLTAVAYVVAHHGVLGVLLPEAVYNHPGAVANPWLWAGIHGGFVALACTGIILLWKATEREQEQARSYYRQLYEGERAVAQQLKDAERLKAELLAVVSHEFRTPLTGILGFAHTLSTRFDELEPSTAISCAEAVERQARRLTRLVQNLLAASGSIGSGTGTLDLSTVVRTLATDFAEELGDDRVVVDLGEGLQAEIGHDAAYLLLGNLIDNALKFAVEATTVTVKGRREEDEVVLEVANAAPDLAPAEFTRLFGAFVQGDSSDTRPRDGLGLGLSVVHRIVDAQGGQVTARSEAGVVVFTVRLPAVPAAVAAVSH